MKAKGLKVYVLGNGNQAPYGIGEIIDVIPVAHWRKIQRLCENYYKQPTLRFNDKKGPLMEWEYTQLRVVE